MRKRLVRQLALVFPVVCLVCAGCSTTSKKPLTHSEKAELYVQIAASALLDNDPTGALQSLAMAEQEDADLPELHHVKALAFFAKHDLKSAVAEAKRAVTLAPLFSDANNTLGKFLMDLGDYQSSIAPLVKAADDPLYRDSYKPLTNLGILYYRRGEFAQAESYLNRAILASPVLACVAHYYRGHIDLKNSHFKDAIRDYDQASQKYCGGFADAQLALGVAYEKNKQYDKARRAFLDVESRYPNTDVSDQAVSHLRVLP